MASLNLSLIPIGKKKKQINFVKPRLDFTGLALSIGLIITLILSVLFTAGTIALSLYSAQIQADLEFLRRDVEQVVAQLQQTVQFEKEFVVVQDKLNLYAEINTNEKMADLFPFIIALFPTGVRLQSMTVLPASVEMTSTASNQSALISFANNLTNANGLTFNDGKVLVLANVDHKEIMQDTASRGSEEIAFNMSSSFNYRIDNPEVNQ